MPVSKPKNEDEVFEVMRDYSLTKGFSFSDSQLHYMAEFCYLTFEGKAWEGIKYWPAVAMRWVLKENKDLSKKSYSKKGFTADREKKVDKPKGKTVREQILEQKDGL